MDVFNRERGEETMKTAQTIWMEIESEMSRFLDLMKFADEEKQRDLWAELRLKLKPNYLTKEDIVKLIDDWAGREFFGGECGIDDKDEFECTIGGMINSINDLKKELTLLTERKSE